jgi:hypothetical protein
MKSNAFIMPEERFGERPYVVMQELDTAGVSWHVYSEQAPFLFTYIPYFMDFDNAAFMTPPELDSTVLPDDSIITACDEEFPE